MNNAASAFIAILSVLIVAGGAVYLVCAGVHSVFKDYGEVEQAVFYTLGAFAAFGGLMAIMTRINAR